MMCNKNFALKQEVQFCKALTSDFYEYDSEN